MGFGGCCSINNNDLTKSVRFPETDIKPKNDKNFSNDNEDESTINNHVTKDRKLDSTIGKTCKVNQSIFKPQNQLKESSSFDGLYNQLEVEMKH